MRFLLHLLLIVCFSGLAAAQGTIGWYSSFCGHAVELDLTDYPSVRSLRLVLREWRSEEPLAGAAVGVVLVSGRDGEACPLLRTTRLGEARISLPSRRGETFIVKVDMDARPRYVIYETGPIELRPSRRYVGPCLMTPGEARSTHRFHVLGNEALLELHASIPGAVEGVVRRPDGQPYFGVKVVTDTGAFTYTDEAGRYRIERLPSVSTYVRAEMQQRVRRTQSMGIFDPSGTFDLTWVNQMFGLERWLVTYPTYFPRALEPEHAVRVPVHPNSTSVADIQIVELEGFDVVALLWTPRDEVQLLGLVLRPTGRNASGRPRVFCDPNDQWRLVSGQTKRYKCGHVPEGEYTLRAEYRLAGTAKSFVAETKVFVNRLTYDLPALRLEPH